MADGRDLKLPQVPLQSPTHESLVSVTEALKALGMSGYTHLPQIVVYGDRSSGKSSVLEALSGIAFPTKGNLCTRYPIKFILRKTIEVSVKISIVVGGGHSLAESAQIQSFNPPASALNDFSLLVHLVDRILGLKHNDKAISTDVLKIEVSGPTQPSLTLVDLPGL